jgi:predicted nucleic acid-binding protein
MSAGAFGSGWTTRVSAVVSHGRVKADIDLHIAAAAIEADATLVTNDGALLAGDVEGLVAENWI